MKKQRSPGGNVLSDDGGARNNGDHGYSGGRHVASADGGLRNVRAVAATPTSSTPSKPPSTFGKVCSARIQMQALPRHPNADQTPYAVLRHLRGGR